jgi:hypothetical protein
MYNLVVAGGLQPSWVCTAEELPGRVAHHFQEAPLALAALPTDLQLLGWTEPYYTRKQVMAHNELVLMARHNGEPVIVVVASRKNASLPGSGVRDGLHTHTARVGPYVIAETSRSPQPTLLPLLSAPR